MSVEKTANGYRLLQQPAAISRDALPADRLTGIKDRKVSGETVIDAGHGNAYWLDVDFDLGTAAAVGLRIAQEKDAQGKTVAATEIGYDRATNSVYVDRSHSRQSGPLPEKARQTMQLSGAPRSLRLQVLLDKSSLEVFVGDGQKVLTCYVYPDENATGCSAFADKGSATIRQLKIWDLSK
jgi:levanase/fructan beta-fructosidase